MQVLWAHLVEIRTEGGGSLGWGGNRACIVHVPSPCPGVMSGGK